MNRTIAGSDVLIRSVTVERQELQCDLCEWRWLVPEHDGVWAVATVAQLHWDKNHGGKAES